MKEVSRLFNTVKPIGKITLVLISVFLIIGCKKPIADDQKFAKDTTNDNTLAELTIGDSGLVYDTSKEDPYWAGKMQIWATAGAPSGIPMLSGLSKGPTVTVYNSAGINTAIANCPAGKYVYLPNQAYDINATVKLKSNVYLVGESRNGVICKINPELKTETAFAFWTITKSGIYNLTIEGGWGTPVQNWNTGDDTVPSPRPDVTSVSVGINASATDCFLDNVKILNSGRHPLLCNSSHNTFRKLYVDGAINKGPNAEGYFFILGAYNLITDCFITHLRHFTLQGPACEYNVVYRNTIEQEISFHTEDNGNNLIEQNNIKLPADMTAIYYGIMGPWSTQHVLSKHPNYIYKNKVLEQNHNNNTPWSDNSIIYDGPYVVKPIGEAAIYNNFREMPGKTPIRGVLYSVN
jgi:hypothetical protein